MTGARIELASLLGVNRIAVYRRVEKGEFPATRIGRTYVIADKTIANILGKKVTANGKKRTSAVVQKTVKEYGEVLKQFSKGRREILEQQNTTRKVSIFCHQTVAA